MTSTESPADGSAPVVVVSGNPRPGSRTLTVGRTLAETIVESITGTVPAATVTDIEVSAFAADLFRSPEQRPTALLDTLQTIRAARLVVFATPVYKAAYTGLLKAFLDHYQAAELSSVVAVPVVVAGSPAHTFVGELYLRPLLTEIGAVVPTPAFTITEDQLPELASLATDWADRFADVLGRQLGPVPSGEPAGRAGLGVAGV